MRRHVINIEVEAPIAVTWSWWIVSRLQCDRAQRPQIPSEQHVNQLTTYHTYNSQALPQ